jgi:hypothetical protein
MSADCRSLLRKIQTQPHFEADKSAQKRESCIVGIQVAEALNSIVSPGELCVPNGVRMGQKVAVVVKYVDEHPEDMHLEFVSLAREALAKAWSCKGEEEDLSSANAIMPGCRSFLEEKPTSGGRERFKEQKCLGIILGLVDAADLQQPSPFCVPDGVTSGQMVRVVVSYIDRHPETMPRRFSRLASHALVESWPCKPEGGER